MIRESTAPLRLRAVHAALLLGAYAVVTIEALSAFDALNRWSIAVVWLVFAAAFAGWWVRRGRPRPNPARRWADARAWWVAASKIERFLVSVIGGLLLTELVMAILAEPNNYDSQTYHLSRIEHWVADGNLEAYPTAIQRQISLAPGAEYLLAHLRLLTGGDALYNLVQWSAGVLCVFAASRIVAQFGGGRRAQLLAAFVVATTPMVTLQASSTQVDLIVAGWVASVATLVLDDTRRKATLRTVAWIGLGFGLAAVTKATGLLGTAPMLLLWGIAQLRLGRVRDLARVAGTSVAILAIAAVLCAPFYYRNYQVFGSPLGSSRLTDSVPMQRHDPAAILVNGLRIGQTALDTPVAPLSDAVAAAIEGVSRAVGVDPQDRDITFGVTTFPVVAWYPDEDRVSLPIQGVLALLGMLFGLIRPNRFTQSRRLLQAYISMIAMAGLLYAATVKWQPWGNRLIVFALVLAAPVAGLWLDKAMARRWPMRLTVVTIVVAALSATLAVGYGFPRRLVGKGSVFTTSPVDTRFLRRPQWTGDFRWARDQIEASGARRIGLVQQNDNWEYPWWVLLPGREFVAMQSVVPQRPPARPDEVDAIVCTGDLVVCRKIVPKDWTLTTHGYVAYAHR
ncbi:MAG: hypothetical protein HOU81_12180 [Hamadaea sp.]|uniref:DUF2142 domain-containing protein n=1 Tax=Hamadaea sp. TaxID=2024425 RepID=UPI0017D2A94E|nr:DUF2142 domain-containing protein [Hamadaea sp.]NUR71569.1 hypothetical protein [Hamadaea sp.]NUT17902.1 hypothetical protein [Hamadaea sp.]